MTIATDIISTLQNYAGLSALVSNRNLTKVNQNPTYPYNVLSFEDQPINNVEGESSVNNTLLQVDTYAETASEISDIMVQVQAALDASTTLKSVCTYRDYFNFDYDLDISRGVMRFSIWQ